MSQKRKSVLESIPVLILLGILAGAVGGYGVGWMQLRTLNSAASSAAK
jgi:uncharacterized membrane protein